MSPFEVWLSGFFADKALWLADKVTGSVVSEYVKRVIFKTSVRQAIGAQNAQNALNRAISKFESLAANVEIILAQKEQAENEVISLRLANQNLRTAMATLEHENMAMAQKLHDLTQDLDPLRNISSAAAAVDRPANNPGA